MHTAIAATADGVGQAIVVEGPPGIGKTRLVNEALAGAGAQGLRVLRARAEELDSHRPFGTIADALGITRGAVEPPLAEIARLLFGAPTGLGGGTDGALPGAGGDSEFRLVEAMLALVDNLCTRQPVVIAIDDVHWADPATIVVLHRLSRSVRDMPLVVLATCRPTPRPPQLTRLIGSVRDAGHEPLALAPLAPDEVTQLVESVIGRQPGPRLVRQAEAAGGNPFFVTALVAALEASGSMTTTATTAEIDVVSLPPALKLTVLHRLSFITADTLEMLRMASILGTTFSVPDLALVLRRRSVELMPAFREAIDANVIREQGDKIAFEHDLLREALYEDLPLSLRVSLHRDVALTLAGAGAPLVQVAEHFVRGARRGDATALEWLRRAADEATVRTPEIASDLLRRMTDLIDPGDPTRDLVLADWAVSLDMSGRRREAEEICREVLTRPQDPRNEARLRLCLSRTLAVTGRVDEAIEEATRAAALEGLSAVQRARTLGNAANLHLMLARIDRLEELGTVALGAAEEVGDPIAWDIAIFGLAAVAFNRGRFAEALERSSMLRMEDDPQPGARMAQGVLHLHLAAGLLRSELFLRLDRVDESQAALEGTRRRATDFGFRGMLCRAQCTVILHNFLTGDWDDAAAEFDALLDLCEDLEDHPAILLISYSVRSMVALYRGDGAQAAAMLAEAGAYRSLDPYRDQWYTTAQVLLARASGATETAFDLLSEEWDRCVRSGILVPCVNLGPLLVGAAMALGRRDRAEDVAAVVDGLIAVTPGVPSIEAAGWRCRGLLDDDADVLLRAVAALRDGPRPLDLALVAEEAAEGLARAGRSDEAKAMFEETVEVFERLDADWAVARITSRMRELGIRRGSRQRHRVHRTGWDALTTKELSVVELVALGLSNPEVAERLFLSRRTVKAHVSSALRKLSMTSRVELAREAGNRRGPPNVQPSGRPGLLGTSDTTESARIRRS